MKNKAKTTGKLNKAEKFVLQLCLAKPHFSINDLKIPVAKKLGINTDGFKFADVPEPKLPPEYVKAIETAMDVSWKLHKERSV